MNKLTGVILDKASFDRNDIDLDPLLSLLARWRHYDSSLNSEAADRIGEADIVITNKVIISADVISQCPNLKLVLLAATGTDNVDLEACRKSDIVVCNARQYSTPAVVQHTFALILNLMTNMIRFSKDVESGMWQKSPIFCLLDHRVSELEGKQLGIIGYGNLGKKVEQVASAFGMRVVISQRPGGVIQPDRMALDKLLATSDIVSLHCPLTPDTYHLFDDACFRQMQSHSILINTARGAVIDPVALVNALKNGIIGGAGIDVLDVEPPSAEHPLLQKDIPNLLLTPHNAWASMETRQRLVSHLSINLQAWLDGTPINNVT